MGLGDKQAAKLRDLAQQHVDEPVIAAAIFLRKGETASRTIGGFAPGASLGKWAESMQRAPSFPANTLIVVTETKMSCFEAKGGLSWKVKGPLGAYDHGSYQATNPADGKITKFLTLTFLDGSSAELETQVAGVQSFQAQAVEELVARSGAPLG